jgi:hypothetical protein
MPARSTTDRRARTAALKYRIGPSAAACIGASTPHMFGAASINPEAAPARRNPAARLSIIASFLPLCNRPRSHPPRHKST